MSKPATSNHGETPHIDTHGPLHALIESLHHMFIAVSTRIRHMHVRDRKQMEHPKGSFDIWARVGSHIEQIHGEEEPASKRPVSRQAKLARSSEQAPYADASAARSSELSRHYTHKAATENHPHMDEVLRTRAMEHIATALQLARRGNRDSAKLHVGLAESAMHMASRFMSHDDYETFETDVERRLESLLEGTPYRRESADS